jgi:hypothetical protein
MKAKKEKLTLFIVFRAFRGGQRTWSSRVLISDCATLIGTRLLSPARFYTEERSAGETVVVRTCRVGTADGSAWSHTTHARAALRTRGGSMVAVVRIKGRNVILVALGVIALLNLFRTRTSPAIDGDPLRGHLRHESHHPRMGMGVGGAGAGAATGEGDEAGPFLMAF